MSRGRAISAEVAREYQKKSAEARKRNSASRKTMAECLNAFLDEKTPEGLTRRELIAMSVLKRVFEEGDMKDLKILTEITGELKQKLEVDNKNPVVLLPDNVLQSIAKNAK